MASKDVQDYRCAVQDLRVESIFQIALLRRSKFFVEEYKIRACLGDRLLDFRNFAFPNEGGRVTVVELLGHAANDIHARGGCKLLKLVERIVCIPYLLAGLDT